VRPLRKPTTDVFVTVVGPDGAHRRPDVLAGEEPLEIRVAGPGQASSSVAVTMRTPGHDFELAVGFLAAEGLLGATPVRQVRYCMDGGEQQYNVVTVDVPHPVDPGALTRRFAATAACGLCGKATIDDVAMRCDPVAPGPTIEVAVLPVVGAHLATAQPVFARTGGLHAAGLYTAAGEPLVVREDIGRHNAVDKVVGATLLRPPAEKAAVLAVSGRLGYEIVQKAVAAGIGLVVAVSAPSSLAVETAERFGVTLVGFLRGATANVYSHPERLGL
jgi:FdhD protein